MKVVRQMIEKMLFKGEQVPENEPYLPMKAAKEYQILTAISTVFTLAIYYS